MFNKVLSIDVGLHRTRICEVDYLRKNPHVYKGISFPTPENTFEDGYIRDKVTFSAQMKEKILQAGMKSKRVIFTISSSKIANREVIIPDVNEKRIQDIVNSNASEYFPVDVSMYSISYSILQKIIQDEKKKIRLLVIAAPENLIQNYYNIAEMMGFDILAIDYYGNSIYQIIQKQVNDDTNLVIQIDEQSTLINIMENNVLELQRNVPYGTNTVIEAVMKQPYFKASDRVDALKQLCSRELIQQQQENYEREAAVTLSPALDGGVMEENYEAYDEVLESLRSLVNSILRVLKYYDTKHHEKKIQTIFITGQGAKFPGMEKLLQAETGIKVKKLELLNSVVFNKNISLNGEYQSDYISCIGASINPNRFAPKDYQIKEMKKNNIHSVIVIFSSAVVLSIVLVVTAVLGYKTTQLEYDRLTREINAIGDLDQIYTDHAIAEQTTNTVEAMYMLTISPNERLNELITEMEVNLPSNALVESLNVSSTDIALSIKVDNKATATKALQQLRGISGLTQIGTSEIVESEDEFGLKTVRLIITGQYQSSLSSSDTTSSQEEAHEEQ